MIADIAFVDRADIKAYVGPPTLQARYEILRSCFQELLRTGILSSQEHDQLILLSYASLREKLNAVEAQAPLGPLLLSKLLLEAAEVCEGLSGRALRKLPFLAHAALTSAYNCDASKFLSTLVETAKRELSELTT